MRKSETIGVMGLLDKFPDEQAVVEYLEHLRWGDTPTCTKCGSVESLTPQKQLGRYWRKSGRHYFIAWQGTPLEYSKIPKHKWIIAVCLLVTARKGISSLRLSKELDISQQSAWYMFHRLREAGAPKSTMLAGTVEIDETYIGGKQRNRHDSKPCRSTDGSDKHMVLGIRQCGGRVKAKPIGKVNIGTMNHEVGVAVEPGSTVYTDEHGAYGEIHTAYKHGKAHINGIKSVWAVIKRGYNGVYHQRSKSKKHLHRYINEFALRLHEGNVDIDTMGRIAALFCNAEGKRITYDRLTK